MVNKNYLAAAAYFFGILGAIAVYLISDKNDRFIRFHAIQSFLFNISVGVIMFIVTGGAGMHAFMVGWAAATSAGILGGIVSVLAFILWLVLVIKTAMGEKLKLPVLGNWAEQWSR